MTLAQTECQIGISGLSRQPDASRRDFRVSRCSCAFHNVLHFLHPLALNVYNRRGPKATSHFEPWCACQLTPEPATSSRPRPSLTAVEGLEQPCHYQTLPAPLFDDEHKQFKLSRGIARLFLLCSCRQCVIRPKIPCLQPKQH